MFCTQLQYAYCKHLALGGSSEQAANIMMFYVNTWQDMQAKPFGLTHASEEAFRVKEEHFSTVIGAVQDVRVQITSLCALHAILFPYMCVEGFVIYYTPKQVSRLAWAMVGRVDRIISDPDYVWLIKPRTQAPKPVVNEEALVVAQEAKGLLSDMLTSMAVTQCDEIAKTNSRDTKRVLELATGIADVLEIRSTISSNKKAHVDNMLDHVFFGEDHVSEDRELARALALSQAMADDEEAEYQRNMERAMAESMRGM